MIPEQEMPQPKYTKDTRKALFNSCQTVRYIPVRGFTESAHNIKPEGLIRMLYCLYIMSSSHDPCLYCTWITVKLGTSKHCCISGISFWEELALISDIFLAEHLYISEGKISMVFSKTLYFGQLLSRMQNSEKEIP